jgi:hypothetical protein
LCLDYGPFQTRFISKMKWIFIFILFMLPFSAQAQSNESGWLSLGVRSTVSLFDHGTTGKAGLGSGGQFRIQLSERINTEWYADYITSGIEEQAHRQNFHIGWSVLYYFLPRHSHSKNLFQPFFEAGHCFDYSYLSIKQTEETADRWSSAVQMGTGTHMNLTSKFDLSLKAQYMAHLGSELHTHLEEGELRIEAHKGVNLEGHLLITLSANYKIGKLW